MPSDQIDVSRFAARVTSHTMPNDNGSISNSSIGSSRVAKKVKFDLATVAFQVDYYDASVDYRPRGSLWQEHVHPGRSGGNLLAFLLRQMSAAQWAKVLVLGLCALAWLVQSVRLVKYYHHGYRHSHTYYAIPSTIELPSLTLCLPVIIPFDQGCLNRTTAAAADGVDCSPTGKESAELQLFNRSMSEFGHQCKVRLPASLSSSAAAAASPTSSPTFQLPCTSLHSPIETYFNGRHCYTYHLELASSRSKALVDGDRSVSITEVGQTSVSVRLQATASGQHHHQPNDQRWSPELYVHHQAALVPVDTLRQALRLPPGRQMSLAYSFVHQTQLDNCGEYRFGRPPTEPFEEFPTRQQCLDFCLGRALAEKCGDNCSPASYRLPVRRRVAGVQMGRVCYHDEAGCSDQQVERILEDCHRTCPEDCNQVEVKVTAAADAANEDETETVVALSRRVEPDVFVHSQPIMDTLLLMSALGGQFAFWLMMLVAVLRVIDLVEYGHDLMELYFQGDEGDIEPVVSK